MFFENRRKVKHSDEGEMLEWLKRHAWKACKLQKGFGGSNPPLSARLLQTEEFKFA